MQRHIYQTKTLTLAKGETGEASEPVTPSGSIYSTSRGFSSSLQADWLSNMTVALKNTLVIHPDGRFY